MTTKDVDKINGGEGANVMGTSRTVTNVAANRPRPAGGFTLIELLIVMAIIATVSALFLGGLFVAEDSARVEKTKATIAKINNIIMARWDTYRTRRVPISITSTGSSGSSNNIYTGVSPATAAGWRLDVLRELMRMEMPNTWTEVGTGPNATVAPAIAQPSLARSFSRKASMGSPTPAYETAETLYLICTTGVGDEIDPRDLFKPDEIKDTDGDGHPEFVDAWGTPIIFIRWAPGFTSELQTHLDPDPFDPRHVYPSVVDTSGQTHSYAQSTGQSEQTFALYPLIVSAGPDMQYDIAVPTGVPTNNDPFASLLLSPPQYPVGSLYDSNSNGVNEFYDNITNHLMGTK